MTLIQCDENCIYQNNGYCRLDTPSAVTNSTADGCMHKVSAPEPQPHHVYSGH